MLENLRAFLEPPLVYVVASGLLILLALLLVLSRYLNRRYVVLRRSAGTDQIACELARIANALEIIAAAPPRMQEFRLPEERPAAGARPRGTDRGGIGLSMFGR